MFNPYERLDIGQDVRNVPPDMIHYRGDFVNYRPVSELGLPHGGQQLPLIDQRAIEAGAMQEADTLHLRMATRRSVPPAEVPAIGTLAAPDFFNEPLPAGFSRPAERAIIIEPSYTTLPPQRPEPTPPPYRRLVSAEETYCETHDRRRALRAGAILISILVVGGIAWAGCDQPPTPRPAITNSTP